MKGKRIVTKKPKLEKKDEESSEANSEFENYSGNEEFDDYKPEGYHPVIIGKVCLKEGESFFNGKYTVIQKLGWGYFSTVWLV
jgi:hypothetical protein